MVGRCHARSQEWFLSDKNRPAVFHIGIGIIGLYKYGMSGFRIPRGLRPWVGSAILASLILFAHTYGWITGGNPLELIFEPIVTPSVWEPLDPKNYPSQDPAFKRGLAAYNENRLSDAYREWLARIIHHG